MGFEDVGNPTCRSALPLNPLANLQPSTLMSFTQQPGNMDKLLGHLLYYFQEGKLITSSQQKQMIN